MKKLSLKEVRERLVDGLTMRKSSLRQIKKRCVYCLAIGTIVTLMGAATYGLREASGWLLFGGIALVLYGFYINFKLRCPHCKEMFAMRLLYAQDFYTFCPHCGERLDWDAK